MLVIAFAIIFFYENKKSAKCIRSGFVILNANVKKKKEMKREDEKVNDKFLLSHLEHIAKEVARCLWESNALSTLHNILISEIKKYIFLCKLYFSACWDILFNYNKLRRTYDGYFLFCKLLNATATSCNGTARYKVQRLSFSLFSLTPLSKDLIIKSSIRISLFFLFMYFPFFFFFFFFTKCYFLGARSSQEFC
ncbi:hypothetical protein PUN28_013338 [Cardiocondyla obscurior]|uniref:Uncharacterized protein n=1 Tax=Cardiocondyla obscurior TaxID=286306 RepID=A0AAW2F819_9HYME